MKPESPDSFLSPTVLDCSQEPGLYIVSPDTSFVMFWNIVSAPVGE